MKLYSDLIKFNMVDAIVATGASIIDMDFFEAFGFKHYQGDQFQDDKILRENYIDRIYLSLIHISEPTRLGMISYAVFCLKKNVPFLLSLIHI